MNNCNKINLSSLVKEINFVEVVSLQFSINFPLINLHKQQLHVLELVQAVQGADHHHVGGHGACVGGDVKGKVCKNNISDTYVTYL